MNMPAARTKYISIGLIVLLFALLFWSLSPTEPNTALQKNDYSPTEPNTASQANDYSVDLASIGDPTFSAYVSDVLEKQCPYYEPDGASYRDCLWALVEQNEAAYTKIDPTPEEIDNDCQTIDGAVNNGGTPSGEIILLCRAYRLSAK